MSIQRCYTGDIDNSSDEITCNVCDKTFPMGEAYTAEWIWIRYRTHGQWMNLPYCSWRCLEVASHDFAETELFMAARSS